MAIRATNAGRHGSPVAYSPTTRGKQAATDPTRGYANQDGPGNTTVDYGPHRGGFTPPSQPTSYVDHATPYFDQQHAGDVQRRSELLAGNDAYQQAKAAGDMRGQIAAMMALRGQMQQDRFVAQGGTPDTWQNRFSDENNWPRPTSSIGYSHGPGRPDYATRGTNPVPYGPGNTAPPVRGGAPPAATQAGPVALPPAQNPMFEGYQQGGFMGGGAGVPSGPGGWGPAGGGYQPGQSKSGMGQMPTNSMMGTGTFYGDPSMAATQGRNFPPIGLPTGPRTPVGPYTPPTFDPTGRTAPGGGDFSNLMALFNLQAGGLNASPFGGGGFGMPGGGPEGMMQFGGYRPAAPQGMMYY